jgi:RimJ/RimL family protein N-acetyltransferase
MPDVPAGPALSAVALARAAGLPLKPAPVELTGRLVRLLPVDVDRDAAALHAVSNGAPARVGDRAVDAYDADAAIWRFMPYGPFTDLAAFRAYLDAQVASANTLPMCVRDAATDLPVGVATFMSNQPLHLKIELGGIWYSPLVQAAGYNTEATYLMLQHAFGLGYRRVEWKCDSLNQRSRKAALRMGFRFEGIQEYHMVIKGRSRDTAWFRILDHEWSQVQQMLAAMI